MIIYKCPFCGNGDIEISIVLFTSDAYCYCKNCGAIGPSVGMYSSIEKTKRKAIKAWNKYFKKGG